MPRPILSLVDKTERCRVFSDDEAVIAGTRRASTLLKQPEIPNHQELMQYLISVFREICGPLKLLDLSDIWFHHQPAEIYSLIEQPDPGFEELPLQESFSAPRSRARLPLRADAPRQAAAAHAHAARRAAASYIGRMLAGIDEKCNDIKQKLESMESRAQINYELDLADNARALHVQRLVRIAQANDIAINEFGLSPEEAADTAELMARGYYAAAAAELMALTDQEEVLWGGVDTELFCKSVLDIRNKIATIAAESPPADTISFEIEQLNEVKEMMLHDVPPTYSMLPQEILLYIIIGIRIDALGLLHSKQVYRNDVAKSQKNAADGERWGKRLGTTYDPGMIGLWKKMSSESPDAAAERKSAQKGSSYGSRWFWDDSEGGGGKKRKSQKRRTKRSKRRSKQRSKRRSKQQSKRRSKQRSRNKSIGR